MTPSGAPGRSRATVPLLAMGLAAIAAACAIRWPHIAGRQSEDPLLAGREAAVSGLAVALADTPAERRLPLLLAHSGHASPGLRFAAIDALAERSELEAIDAVERALRDSSSVVRQLAVERLYRLDRERGVRLLVASLRDEDVWVREAAAGQLATLALNKEAGIDRRVVPALVAALDDSSWAARSMSIRALRAITSKPWKARNVAPEADKRAVVARWKAWWSRDRRQWDAPLEYANATPVRPSRVDPAPAFAIRDLQGRLISRDRQKGRLTFLNFWGTWCHLCIDELPALAQLDAQYRLKGVDVIGVALGERGGTRVLEEWCRSHGIAYRVAMATDDITDAFDHIDEIPVSVLIDGRGRIRRRWEGERDFATYAHAIEDVLGGPQRVPGEEPPRTLSPTPSARPVRSARRAERP